MQPRTNQNYQSCIVEDGARYNRYRALTEGMGDPNRRLVLEATLDVMLEQKFGKRWNEEAKQLVSDLLCGKVQTEGTTTTGDIATYVKVILPVITRTFWTLQLMNLVSTQPMSGPTARIFFLNVLYGSGGGIYDPSLYSGGARVDQYIDPYYADSVECPEDTVRQLDMEIDSMDISSKTKRLNMKWSDELEQDLRACFGIDMDSLAVRNLGDEIAREVDQEGLDVLVAGATAGNVNWSQTPTGAYASLDPKVYGATLWDALIDADTFVWQKMNRNTNWIIAGVDDINRLRKLGPHKLIGGPGGDGLEARQAMEYQGLLDGRWKVYQARHFPANKFLLGYNGGDFTDSPAVHSPYVPLEIKNKVQDLEGNSAYKSIRGAQWRGKTTVVQGDGLAEVTVTA